MKRLDDYFKLQKEIYEYFGYKEDWVVIPLDDCRDYFWFISGGEAHGGSVTYAEKLEDFSPNGNYYGSAIYTQRFLPKWVYRGEEYTMICVDTQTDGNKFLSVFENSKEIDPKDLENYDEIEDCLY